MVYAKMGVWERIPLRSHSLSFPFLLHTDGVASVHLPPPPTVCNMPPVEHHPTIRGMRGRTPLAANDGGKTLYRVA
jgi:hypothetical protein